MASNNNVLVNSTVKSVEIIDVARILMSDLESYFEVRKDKKYKIRYMATDGSDVTVEGTCIALYKCQMNLDIDYKQINGNCVDLHNTNFYDKILTIPYFQILAIDEVVDKKEDECLPPCPPPPCPHPHVKEVAAVAVLGLSAEVVHSLVVRIRFYHDDNYDTEVIPVDMKVGNKYKIFYVGHDPDHTMYEIEGTLLKIRSVDDEQANCECCNPVVREETTLDCGCEQVGMHNTVYNTRHFMQLDKASNIGNSIIFDFDTSTNFREQYDHIMLRDIRGVELLVEMDEDPDESVDLDGSYEKPDPSEDIDPGFSMNIPCINISSCEHCQLKGTCTKYQYEQSCKCKEGKKHGLYY